MAFTHHAPPTQAKFRLRAVLFLFLLACYLFTYTPQVNSSDGLAMFATAESLVRRGALDVEQIRWMDLQQGTYGLNGLLYSRKGIGVPLGLLPLTGLGLIVPVFGPVTASLLFNAMVTALTGLLLLVYLQGLGYGDKTGLWVALAFGLASLAWPYAKSLFSDPFSGLLLLAAALALLNFQRSGQSRWPLLAGLLLGWNVATRYAEAIFLPIFGILLLYYLIANDELRTLAPARSAGATNGRSSFATRYSLFAIPLLAFAAPLLLTGLALMAFNVSRYGDPFNTGYLPSETFSAIWLDGIVGQLVSPGRGLFLFSPILILSIAGFLPFLRRHRAESLLAANVILIHLLLYGKWFMWHGGFAWGPRFLIPTLPFWAMLLAPVFEKTIGHQPSTNSDTPYPQLHPPALRPQGRAGASVTHYALRIIVPLLFTTSILIQLPFLLVDFSAYQGWLLDTGLPLFARATFFEWWYSPFVAMWSFISMPSLDLAWAWGGAINWTLLAVLLTNLIVCGANLRVASGGWWVARDKPANPLTITSVFTTLATVILLLAHAHSLPPQPLQQVVAALNADVVSTDAVITNGPSSSEPFAERYQGRAPVLGLNTGGPPLPPAIAQRLAETISQHRQIWWLPNNLPPEASAVEQTLLAAMVRVRSQSFNGQRLVLFAAPPTGEQRAVGANFDDGIQLTDATVPPQIAPGQALTIELAWQAQAPIKNDYHIFVHLVDMAGQLVAQSDGQPAQWTRPTTSWAVAETVIDRHGLWVPADAPAGVYRLRVGLYQPESDRRLRLASGADAVEFTVSIH